MKILLIFLMLFFIGCGTAKLNNSENKELGVLQNIELEEMEMRRND